MKIKIEDIFYKTILLFPIFTVLTDNGIINKCLFTVLMASYLYLSISGGIRKKSFISIFIALVLMIWSMFQTEYNNLNINMLFYYPFFILYTVFVIDSKDSITDWLIKHKRFIDRILIIWTLIVGISIFIPSCYKVKEAGELYFGSFAGTIFRLGPSAFFIQSLALVGMSFYANKKYIFYMIVPMYCFLMGSSRTYFVIGTCLFVIAWYWFGVSKKVFLCTTIPLGCLAAWLVMKSALGAKILYTLDPNQYGDFWFRITSSRSVFWAKDIYAWKQQSFLNKIFGCGLDFTNRIAGIWAHNDFIELICSVGIIGLVLYLISFYKMFRKYMTKKTMPLIVISMVIIAWLFNAFFNMHYTYFCCTLGYPFILLAISNYYRKVNLNALNSMD